MNQMRQLVVFLGLIGASIGCGANTPNTGEQEGSSVEAQAMYEITFTSLWDAGAHLGRPRSAHFSPLVISSHTADYVLFPKGDLANSALEDVAELGRTGLIQRELNSAVSQGVVDSFTITENQFVPGTPVQTVVFEVSKEASLFSLVSMIAPSPDWIVGVNSISLVNSQGEFIEDTGDIMLFAYDAGTEDGDRGGNFSINNNATANPTPIEILTGRGFEQPFALLRLRKIN